MRTNAAQIFLMADSKYKRFALLYIIATCPCAYPGAWC